MMMLLLLFVLYAGQEGARCASDAIELVGVKCLLMATTEFSWTELHVSFPRFFYFFIFYFLLSWSIRVVVAQYVQGLFCVLFHCRHLINSLL